MARIYKNGSATYSVFDSLINELTFKEFEDYDVFMRVFFSIKKYSETDKLIKKDITDNDYDISLWVEASDNQNLDITEGKYCLYLQIEGSLDTSDIFLLDTEYHALVEKTRDILTNEKSSIIEKWDNQVEEYKDYYITWLEQPAKVYLKHFFPQSYEDLYDYFARSYINCFPSYEHCEKYVPGREQHIIKEILESYLVDNGYSNIDYVQVERKRDYKKRFIAENYCETIMLTGNPAPEYKERIDELIKKLTVKGYIVLLTNDLEGVVYDDLSKDEQSQDLKLRTYKILKSSILLVLDLDDIITERMSVDVSIAIRNAVRVNYVNKKPNFFLSKNNITV